jgi:hypothetical protein
MRYKLCHKSIYIYIYENVFCPVHIVQQKFVPCWTKRGMKLD